MNKTKKQNITRGMEKRNRLSEQRGRGREEVNKGERKGKGLIKEQV